MARTLTTSALALLLTCAACGGESVGEARSLQAAVERTLAADGFHIEGAFTVEGPDIESEGHYVAPDRMLMESFDGTRTSTSIVVGRNNYLSESEDSERFSLWEMPCEVGVDTFIPALSVARNAEDVRQSAGAFTFRADGDGGTRIEGEARAEDGYLVELTLAYQLPRINERVLERWTFSDFGATVPIEPPPADQVVEDSQFEGHPSVVVVDEGEPEDCPT
jgi:hypothetical protein